MFGHRKLLVPEPQEKAGAKPPRAVDEQRGHDASGMPAAAYRHTLERHDNEPGDERWRHRAENHRVDPIESTLRQVTDDPEEDDAPQAAPEREGPDLRHTEGLRGLQGKRHIRCHADAVENHQHALVEHERRREPRDETTSDVADAGFGRIMRGRICHGMSFLSLCLVDCRQRAAV